MPTQTDYLTLSQAVYTIGGTAPVAPSGWTVLMFQSLQSGMQAAAFQNNTTHQIVIAYEGTNLGNLSPSNFSSYLAPQLSADAAIAAGKNPDANKVALAFQRVEDSERENEPMVHHPAYDFNDSLLPIGASYWATLVEQQLAKG